MTAVSIMWSMLLNTHYGMLPHLLGKIGITMPNMLSSTTWAMPTVIFVTVWKGFGYTLTILSAAALGVDAVLLTSAGSDPLYRRAVRVSMGTVFQVPWTYLPADTGWQETLHTLGFRTAAMALRDDSLRIDDARLRTLPRLAIVLGTEGDGLAGSTIAACDYTVRIPMAHGVDSLNVAASSAVAFYAFRQLSQLGR